MSSSEPLLATLAGGFDRNLCYVFGCRSTREGALVDAAVRTEEALAAFESLELRPMALLVTHGHGDHLSEATEFVRLTGAGVLAFDPSVRARVGAPSFTALADGAVIQIGEQRLEAMHTPGHSPDSMCFRGERLLFSGDTLFVGRTGRTLGPGSSVTQLYRSVQRLKALAPETVVRPGHDYGATPTTTIGREMRENPFLQADSEEAFVRQMERYERDRRRS